MLEQPEAEIGAVLGRVVEQQGGELEDEGSLHGEQVAEEEGRLVGAEGVEKNAEENVRCVPRET